MFVNRYRFRSTRVTRVIGLTLAITSANTFCEQAQAQAPLVSACSGVRLNRSVVTDIMAPVVTGISTPIETRVNSILDIVQIIPLVGQNLPRLNTDVSGLLGNAAAGAPITLQVFDRNGNAVGPGDACNLEADTLSLANARGLSIGGNRITGLGSNGAFANAADINAIAFGNGASTGLGATGSVAIGQNANVTTANSVAIGAGSVAPRGPQLAYAAIGLDDDQVSAGEFSVGAAGMRRQITNVAAGSAADDAVNVAQLEGVAGRVDEVSADLADLAAGSVRYDSAARDRVTLAGTSGTVIANVAAGTLAAGSTEAVNGGQLFDTNQNLAALDDRVTTHSSAIANHETRITVLENAGAGGGSPPPTGPLRYADAGSPDTPNGGTPTDDVVLVGASGAPVRLHRVAEGQLAAGSTDAVNGGQLFATNQTVAQNTVEISTLNNLFATLSVQVTANTTAITDLSTRISIGGSTAPGPVRYSDAGAPTVPNAGASTDHVTLVGASGGAVQVHNVADGSVAAGSTDAVNGGQLHATNQAVAAAQAMAEEATALGLNSVQYDSGRTSVTFGGTGAPPVLLGNVAAGIADTDAANVGQLNAGMAQALADANAYTDLRIEALGRNMSGLRRDVNAGTANALAAAALPQAADPGRGMISAGTAYYQGQSAFALGLSVRSDDGRAVLRAGASVDTRGRAGLNAGAGIQF